MEKLQVLIVDDDDFMLEFVTVILHQLGVSSVKTATGGQEGLAKLDASEGRLDVIFCDLNMPSIDGMEFMRHLTERGFQGGIVLISGEDDRILDSAGKLAEAHQLQLLGTLHKPMSVGGIKQLLGQLDGNRPKIPSCPVDVITERELRLGIERDELTLFFQPKVDISSGEVVSAEALVRWQHPDRGIIGPGAFVPIAEQHGLITELTASVLRKALRALGQWQAAGYDIKVAVNFSAENLTSLSLPEDIVAEASRAGVNTADLILEVTESRLMQSITTAMEILTRLSLKKVALSIDDFGTGFSSLEQLQRAPFTELKIDRSFVTGVSNDASARAILESSIELGRKLDMVIVAEGIETQEDWDLVHDMGCDVAQGYFIAKPMPGDLFMKWLANRWVGGPACVTHKDQIPKTLKPII